MYQLRSDGNKYTDRLWIIGYVSATALLAIVLFVISIQRKSLGFSNFVFTHYLFNYENEFLRRGLAGEVFRQLGVAATPELVGTIYSFALLALWVSFSAAGLRLIRLQPRADLTLLLAFIATSPATFSHLAWSDYGRVDIFIILLQVLALAAVIRLAIWPAFATICVVSAAAMLIHELAFFAVSPMLFAAWMLRFRHHIALSAGIFAALNAGAVLLIWRFGGADQLSFDEMMEYLLSITGDQDAVTHRAVAVLYRDLKDNLFDVFVPYLKWNLVQHILLLAGCAPAFAIGVVVCRAVYNRLGIESIFVFFGVAAPLALYPLGHDYFRWWSFVFINAFLILLFVIEARSDLRDMLLAEIARVRGLLIAGILLGVGFGGLADTGSFSWDTSPLGFLKNALR